MQKRCADTRRTRLAKFLWHRIELSHIGEELREKMEAQSVHLRTKRDEEEEGTEGSCGYDYLLDIISSASLQRRCGSCSLQPAFHKNDSTLERVDPLLCTFSPIVLTSSSSL